jgi:hypothetical protein
MPINVLYHNWFHRIQELRPGQRITQVRAFVWLMVGIYQSRSVTLSRVAGKIPGAAKLPSITRRLERVLANPAVQVRSWYEPVAKQWLQAQARNIQQIRLIVDGSKVGFGHQLLIVSLAYRKRAIPIAWTWVPYVKGHSSVRQQLALLGYVHRLLPTRIAVILTGDREFGNVPVLRQLDRWHWDYVLRQKQSIHIYLARDAQWKDFGSYVSKPGQSLWLGSGYLAEKEIYPVNLLVHWKAGEDEPWCLATNLSDRQLTLRAFRLRMWIEEMFGDLKRHGFDLESTMLRSFIRLSRLTLAVALLYDWLMAAGTDTIHAGLRHLVDRKDRRDLCIFQIGLRMIERLLVNSLSIHVHLCSYR